MKKVLTVFALATGLIFVSPTKQAEAQGGIRAIVTDVSARASGNDTYLDIGVVYTGALAGGRTSDISVVPMLLVPGVTPTNLARDISTALVNDAARFGNTLTKQNILLPDYQQGQ
jgi:hypothetical protein